MFLDGLVEKVYEFGDGKVREHLGGIYDFLHRKDMESLRELERKPEAYAPKSNTPTASAPAPRNTETPKPQKLTYAEQKERAKMVSRAEKKVKQCEEEIAALENTVKEIEDKISAGDASQETLAAYDNATKKLENAMSVWELAQMELDNLK